MAETHLEGPLSEGGAVIDGARVSFDPDLPISAHVDEIAALLAEHQVVVVAGETGSGKTTQLPKICLAMGRRHIAHTQPRRIAARSVAARIAEEMGVELGDQVGFQVRFTRQATSDTALTVMTDGVLLAEIAHDRDLRAHDTIIIDEAHERSLNIDFLLGYLKQLLPRRRDLKVIITSATIDTARFAAHFDDAPVVEVSGRTYPVEVRYRPLLPDEADDPGDRDDSGQGRGRGKVEPLDQISGVVAAVRELVAEGPGDVLVFLAGEREIRDTAEALEDARLPATEVLPLYARLSAAEQHRVFTSHTGRRVVLATNVAETSLTVPGIRYVVDPGTARISRYSSRTKVQRLPVEPISQASANQRAGRCGRVAPGVCIRLYSEADFQSRPEFTEPEILRTNLAAVILQMAQARLGAIADFPFVEPPDRSQVVDGIRLLDELGALRPGHRDAPRLTAVGRQLAAMPLDPRMGRMLIEGARQGSLREVLVIVAALSIPDVRERPADDRARADAFHRRFWSEEALTATLAAADRAPDHRSGDWSAVSQQTAATPHAGPPARQTPHTLDPDRSRRHRGRGKGGPRPGSAGTRPPSGQPGSGEVDGGGDIMAIERLWRYLRHQRRAMGSSAFRRMCREEHLNFLRVREWEELHHQLRQVARDLGLRRNGDPAPTDRVLVALLSGLLSHVGLAETPPARGKQGRRGPRPGPRQYLGARGARFAINPGSVLARHPPELVMAVELVETTRLWARTVAAIRPEWVEEVGAHLLKRQYSEPHWAASTASVVATERATLFGVPVWADRRVSYTRIDPVVSRQIFIRSALVERDWRTRHEFLRHNDRVLDEAEDLEERRRQRGLVADDETLVAFYDRRIPDGIVSGSHFDAWWRRVEDRHCLDLSLDDLVDPDAVAVDDFPDHWQVGDISLPVRYVFDPGSGHDGVTVRIRLTQLNQVAPEPFSWQVPGLRQELATELIRGLPKAVRTQLVPAPDRAREALRWLDDHDGDHTVSFPSELGRALRALTGVTVAEEDWDTHRVPAHLRVGFEVVDAPERKAPTARPMAHSEDLAQLRTTLAPRATRSLTKAVGGRRIHGATQWSFGAVARQVEVGKGAGRTLGYPAVVDEGDAVGVVVEDSPRAQRLHHGAGVVRLLLLTLPDPTRWVVSHLDNPTKLALATSPYPSVPDLLADARAKATDSLARRVAGDLSGVRDRQAFEGLALEVRQEQAETMARVVATTGKVLTAHERARAAVATLGDLPAAQDMAGQLDDLIFPRFISMTPDPWFWDLPRWVEGVAVRAGGLMTNAARDARRADELAPLLDEYDALCARQPPGRLPEEVERVGFLLEELRIQFFAQRLGTRHTVSPQRIRAAMAEIS